MTDAAIVRRKPRRRPWSELLSLARAKRIVNYEILPYWRHSKKKPITRQIREIVALTREYGFLPHFYFRTIMYADDFIAPVGHYIPKTAFYKYINDCNNLHLSRYAKDKVLYRKTLQQYDLPVVQEIFSVDKAGEIRDGLDELIDARRARELLQAHGEDIFAKPISGMWGEGARIIRFGMIPADFPEDERDIIIQPVLRQHAELARIYPHAINTVRIDTLKTETGIINNAAILRIGAGGATIDNASAGGLVVGIDLESGRLYPTARKKPKFDTRPYRRHPDTGTAFAGVTVAFWGEIRDVVVKAAEHLPFVSLAWDVAVTPEGPVLIECNTEWNLDSMQIGWGGLGPTELGRRVRRHYGLPEAVDA